MSGHPRVLCIGSVTADSIAIVDRIPRADERELSDGFVAAGGGPAATAAVTLARLGVEVAMGGVVGDDEAGRFVRDSLEDEGVDTSLLLVDSSVATTRSIILVERESGTRTIVTTPSRTLTSAEVPPGVEWVHVDQVGYPAVRRLSGRRDWSLSVDDGNRVAGLELAGVELYAPTRAVLQERFAGDIADGLLAARRSGAGDVVATAGGAGAYVLSPDGVTHVPAAPVDAVSTLGAGDVFHGALIAGLLRGDPIVDAARFAGRIAAASCRALDGRSAIPRRAELDAPNPHATGDRSPEEGSTR
jgi:sulfofructose kinase